MGKLEPTRLPTMGSSKGALFVAEQLGLEQVPGNDAQLIFMNGLSCRSEMEWMARATISLPVPLSP
jgi:hypothetical protein